MSILLSIEQRNEVLRSMAVLIDRGRQALLEANQQDIAGYTGKDQAMYDRLLVDSPKIDGMITSLEQLIASPDPLGRELYHFHHENGLEIRNKTAPFGTVMIIYESRPDVTVEAAGIAFKSGNHILLKGGKESLHSNQKIVSWWHQALALQGLTTNWIDYLQFTREATQAFLQQPDRKIDLIVPRGGEKLIDFVKQHATCPVIVSGRGNNFVYVAPEADMSMAVKVIVNSKAAKISACNAVDKVLIDKNIPDRACFIKALVESLGRSKVRVLGDAKMALFDQVSPYPSEAIWYEEFLDYKIVLGSIDTVEKAVEKINHYGGGHSATIITENAESAAQFMQSVDAAAVYHNAATRFTDGGQFGLGGELAISTDKLHHRGPMGLQHLVTNKWYIYGDGQVR